MDTRYSIRRAQTRNAAERNLDEYRLRQDETVIELEKAVIANLMLTGKDFLTKGVDDAKEPESVDGGRGSGDGGVGVRTGSPRADRRVPRVLAKRDRRLRNLGDA